VVLPKRRIDDDHDNDDGRTTATHALEVATIHERIATYGMMEGKKETIIHANVSR
jgi:dGTP triphosphohydrolase